MYACVTNIPLVLRPQVGQRPGEQLVSSTRHPSPNINHRGVLRTEATVARSSFLPSPGLSPRFYERPQPRLGFPIYYRQGWSREVTVDNSLFESVGGSEKSLLILQVPLVRERQVGLPETGPHLPFALWWLSVFFGSNTAWMLGNTPPWAMVTLPNSLFSSSSLRMASCR